jgi:hypothetical protein
MQSQYGFRLVGTCLDSRLLCANTALRTAVGLPAFSRSFIPLPHTPED